ncbi:MAG: hypothetical protein KBI09_03790 [Mesotoga sp.]|uniref:Uncharacterized protein n=1 Tax=Mesotoga infera TaxID=1236046 RepID=A0A7Z7LHJ2_9BACT|nr:hypothetical protein [Mesotoga infera]MBP8660027.1 hypothetical protein [Mesotoga sp.]SSC14223.1 conserved membrane protein of unknown function [Mesotoga infera]HON27991.1 hypothetical protein [Mesotoga infera]
MLIQETIELLVILILISGLATAFAVATVFAFYLRVRRPPAHLMFMNSAASTTATLLASLVLTDNRKLFLTFLFFVAYFFIYNSLGRHIISYDDTFRVLFLSMGYTREEFFMNYLLVQGKWKLIESNISFASSSALIMIFSRELSRFFPDQWVGVILVFAFSTFVLSVSRWIGEDFRNKLSKEE